jgi:DNA-binding CsgD family transcriptional regulator
MDLVARYDLWLEAVRDLLQREHAYFPRAAVGALIAETMDTAAVSWNWMEAGSFGCEFDFDGSTNGWSMLQVPAPVARRMQARHPLVQWFGTTGDPAPMTVGRLPRSVAPAADFALVAETLRPGGLEQQLSIPYHLSGGDHRAFVVARGDEDFPREDVDLARRIQPLLGLLDRHVRASHDRRTACAADAGLTAREIAVLGLLADGRTAAAIARRLGISPRTVTCHLQHIYRKLGVTDRVRAVLAAQTLGLGTDPADLSTSRTRPSPAGPPPEVLHGEVLHEDGHRWMLLCGDPATPWQPSPDEPEWERAYHGLEGDGGVLTVVWSR